MTRDAMIEIKKLTKAYEGKPVLSIDDFHFRRGLVYGIVGPNGSGKSTLLSIIALLTRPTSGTLKIDGATITPLNSAEIRKKISLVHQDPVMFQASVRKNVSAGLAYRGVSRREIGGKVKQALSMVGLNGFEKRNAKTLSGGEKKRVAIARSLIISPAILLLDEPTANVDSVTIRKIEEIIKNMRNSSGGGTIIFATHNINQAYHLSDEVLTLMDGKPQDASIKNLYSGESKIIDNEPVFDTGRNHVRLAGLSTGVRHISIDPNDIFVSHDPISSSARNVFSGEIIEIKKNRDRIALTISINGENFSANVTATSFFEMNLTIGANVSIAFKASAVVSY